MTGICATHGARRRDPNAHAARGPILTRADTYSSGIININAAMPLECARVSRPDAVNLK